MFEKPAKAGSGARLPAYPALAKVKIMSRGPISFTKDFADMSLVSFATENMTIRVFF